MTWPNRALLVLSGVGLLALPLLAQERPSSPEYREACDRLVCQCGCHSTISTCKMERCHSAEPIREEVWERLSNGETVEAVLAVFRDRYGLTILAAPPTSGFHLTAWVMPFVALALGLFVVRQVLRSWRRQTTTSEDPVVQLSDAERARIERELSDFSQ